MIDEELKRLLREKLKREKAVLDRPDLLAATFPEQRAFITDPAKLKAALCTRRAGKSYGCGLMLFNECLVKPGTSCLYIGLTKEAARRTINKDVFMAIQKKYKVKATYESKYTWVFDNGSEIYLTGANANSQEQDKIRGQSYSLIVVDEASKYKQNLTTLVYDVLLQCVSDYNGSIALIGTPGNLIKGLFYEVTNGLKNGWATHKWTWQENPYKLKEREKTHSKLLADDPLIIETPGYQQEWLGKWVIDFSALVYRFDNSVGQSRNRIDELPDAKYEYLLSIDFGAHDPTALVVMCWSPHDDKLYIIDQYKFDTTPNTSAKSRYDSYVGITEVLDKIKEFESKYPINRYVGDPGSAQVITELRRRHNIPIEPADKVHKIDFIHLMNSDFITGKIKIVGDNCEPIVDEWNALIWDETVRKDSNRRQEKASLPNHLADACLYGWRSARNYLVQPVAPPKPLPHSQQAIDAWVERELQKLQPKNEYDWEPDDINLNPEKL